MKYMVYFYPAPFFCDFVRILSGLGATGVRTLPKILTAAAIPYAPSSKRTKICIQNDQYMQILESRLFLKPLFYY